MSLASCNDDASTGSDAAPLGGDAGDAACAPQPLAIVDDAGGDCSAFVELPCGVPPTATVDDCFPDLTSCASMCASSSLFYCLFGPTSCNLDAGILDAAVVVECVTCAGGGRRPRGLVEARILARTELGAHFARLAHLEAASVKAFCDLERWLAGTHAPLRLRRAARCAVADERRHARVMRGQAKRFGGEARRVRVRNVAPPTLVELLEDDAVEGCAGETFGALVATWQMVHARDVRVRAIMRRVAVDETRHAALAWEILRWGLVHITPAERERVRQKLTCALARIESSVPRMAAAARRETGLPNRAAAQRLATGLRLVAALELERAPRRGRCQSVAWTTHSEGGAASLGNARVRALAIRAARSR